ncbi:hypothetical protein CMV_025951 [Castanea mollissima]|uniref:Uncharacterized protein n=1 Tax=Castanea mollissima TaxID=60419 RepID=A0A8J4QKR7_9ROSI|nr:hypothetical protein CMV_025951 [Castanea mollissima]
MGRKIGKKGIFYADFLAIDRYHFTLNMPSNHIYMLPAVETILQRNSDIAKRIAQETAKLMYQQESGLFDFRRMEVSPLLLAMVHELIGIQDNKVDLRETLANFQRINRRLCCHQNKMPFSKLTCMRILEILG